MKSILLIIYGKKYIKVLRGLKIKIFVLTNFHKKFLEKNGIDSKKIEISYNPSDIVSSDNFYDSNSDYVVYAGRLTNSKGITELLEAWEKTNTNFILKIIGTGELYPQLKNKYKNNSKIEIYGQLSNSDVLEEIKDSRAVITCTKMFEGQPRILCEASSLKVPSIFPSFGGMDEFFQQITPFHLNSLTMKIYKKK